MSQQSRKTHLKALAIQGGRVSLFLGIAFCLSHQSAIALPNAPSTNRYNSETPPDIIIDSEDTSTDLPDSTVADPRFTCQFFQGQYTVMYHPESQSGQGYPWAVPRELGDGWTEERRCNEISYRLESYRPDGLLELRTSVENNYETICVTTQRDRSCRIVLTVPPGQDAQIIRDRVFSSLTVADSGQMTQGVNTFVGTSQGNQIFDRLGQILDRDLSSLGKRSRSPDGIDLRPFLDSADGGTGTQLRPNRAQPSSSPSLNPDKFR